MRRIVLSLTLLAACSTDDGGRLSWVTHAGGRFFALGGVPPSDPGSAWDAAILTSIDGDEWEPTVLPAHDQVRDVAFGAGQWIAVGPRFGEDYETADDYMLVSPDAVTWSVLPSPLPQADSITSFAGELWMVGRGAQNCARSADGSAWTTWWDQDRIVGGTVIGDCVYNLRLGISESTDGVTWSTVNAPALMMAISGLGDDVVAVGFVAGCPECGGEYVEGVRDTAGTWHFGPSHRHPAITDLATVGDQLFGVAEDGIYRATVTDERVEWKRVRGLPGWMAELAAAGNDVVVVGPRHHAGSYAVVSHDGGESWRSSPSRPTGDRKATEAMKKWWRRRESNPRPKMRPNERLRV